MNFIPYKQNKITIDKSLLAKFAALLLASFIVFTLVGCAKGSGAEEQAARVGEILAQREALMTGPTTNANQFTGDLFLVAGQSNAVSPCEAHAPVTATHTSVTDQQANQDPLHLVAALNPVTSSMAWAILGDILNVTTGRNVGFVNAAVGSTSSRDWITLMKQFDYILGQGTNYKAILWVQGESDEFGGLSQRESYSNLLQIIAHTRALQPNIPWYIALDSASGSPTAAVRLAQQQVIDDGYAIAGPDADAIKALHNGSTGVHITGEGLNWFAEAWAPILLRDFP